MFFCARFLMEERNDAEKETVPKLNFREPRRSGDGKPTEAADFVCNLLVADRRRVLSTMGVRSTFGPFYVFMIDEGILTDEIPQHRVCFYSLLRSRSA